MLKNISILLMMFLINSVFATSPSSLVQIDISSMSDADIRELVALNIDITSIEKINGRMDAVVTPAQQKILQKRGIKFESVISDVASFAQKLRDENYFKHFHSNEQIFAELKQAAEDFPHITKLVDIGDSYLKTIGKGGHDIWALKISDEAATDDTTEAEVLYMANMHAREIITPEILLFFMHYLLDHYEKDAYVTHLINNRELWLIPTFNPDGHEYVFTGDVYFRDYYGSGDPIWWRKNMRDNDADGEFNPDYDGVDLNRNFAHAWGLDDAGSSPVPGSVTYRGPEAFSEPESQAIRSFVEQRDFIISLSYHSYSNLWLYPWGYTFEELPEPDLSIFRALADSCVFYNDYRPQPAADLYTVNGDTDDWLYAEHGIWAFTPEVGDRVIDHYFYPDTNRILPLVLENLGPNLFMAYAAGEEPIVSHATGVDSIEAKNSFFVSITIDFPIVLTDSVALDTSSFKLYFRPEYHADFFSVDLIHDPASGYFLGEIPGAGQSGVVYYYVEALDELGRRGTSPRAAPMAVDSFFVRYPVEVQQQAATPNFFELKNNYPNPFNSQTRIEFYLPKKSPISLDIYDVRGRFVKSLMQGDMADGKHVVDWDGTNVTGIEAPSGIYYARLQAPLVQQSIKMLLLR
jgi:hypothetical protein